MRHELLHVRPGAHNLNSAQILPRFVDWREEFVEDIVHVQVYVENQRLDTTTAGAIAAATATAATAAATATAATAAVISIAAVDATGEKRNDAEKILHRKPERRSKVNHLTLGEQF